MLFALGADGAAFAVSSSRRLQSAAAPSPNPACSKKMPAGEGLELREFVFVYRHQTREAVLWCGDAGGESYAVVDGRVESLIL